MMTIGKRIRELRKASGLSQEQLAKQLDVTRQTISNWEASIAQPNLEKIIMISDLFQVSLDQLIKGEKKHCQEADIEKLAKMNWEHRKKMLALIIGIIFILMGIVTYLVTYAVNYVGVGLGYTLYRYIVVGEYVSPIVDLSKVKMGVVILIVLGVVVISIVYWSDIKKIIKKS